MIRDAQINNDNVKNGVVAEILKASTLMTRSSKPNTN